MSVRGIAIETSGREGSVAALADGVVVAAERFPHGLKHAAGLVVMVDRVIAAAGWGKEDVSELYASVGPGSFTGLRIAVTLAKTWWWAARALGRELKVAAVPSVRAVVENLPAEASHAVVAMDAKRGQVFTASYSRDAGGIWQETAPARLDVLAEVIARSPRPLTVTGEGVDFHPVPAEPGGGLTVAPRELWGGRAETVGRLGWEMGRRGEWSDAAKLEPVYVRLPEAEEKWRKERGEG